MDLRLLWESQRSFVVSLPDGETLTVTPLRPTDDLDGIDEIALVATLGGERVAVGRLIALPGDAEIAFLVDVAHQRRGIGAVLRDALLASARERGIYRMHAHVLPHNVAIRRLLDTPVLELVGDRGHVLELVLAEAANVIAS
jgi:GNAT superfamily N-acetyltransferase